MAHIKKLVSPRTGKISYRVHIRTHQKTITKTFKLKKDAVSFAQTIEGNHNLKDVLTEPLLNQTFKKILSDYPGEDYRLNYFSKEIGCLKLNQIKKSQINNCLNALAESAAPATVNRYRNDFGSFAKWVNAQLDDTQWNPQKGIARKTEPPARQDYLSHQEQQSLLEACKQIDLDDTSPTRKLYLFVLTALATGARKGEILALQWKDIQWTDRIIIIRGEDQGAGKTGRREVPIIKPLWDELQRHRKLGEKGLIFPSLEDNTKPYCFRKQWQKASQMAGISRSFVFHSLRHTTASNLAKAGNSLLQIGVILGHKSAQTTLRYAHLVERHALHEITGDAMSHLG